MPVENAFVVLLAAVVAGRILSERALKHLSTEQKAMLLDAFRGQRAYGLIPLAVLLGGYFVLLRFTVISSALLSPGYWLGLLAYLAWNFWFTRSLLASLRLPKSYLTQFNVAQVIQYGGLGVLLLRSPGKAYERTPNWNESV